MSSAPLIGITGRRMSGREVGAPKGFHDAEAHTYLSEYASSVQLAGGIAVHLPVGEPPLGLINRLDGLLITGGDDVDPLLYGRAIGSTVAAVDPVRDEYEISLFRQARRRGLPVLGICRGSQLINVAMGGTLVADLPLGTGQSHSSGAYPRAHRRHPVEFSSGSITSRIYGSTIKVNSFHHQAVEEPGQGVVVTGRAPDGVAESIEVVGEPTLGLQWHPECFGGDPAFHWLVQEAARAAHHTTSTKELVA